MEFVVLLLVPGLALGAVLTSGRMLTALVDGAMRFLTGRVAADELADAAHAQRVLAHFENMRDAVLTGDDVRLERLEDQLMDLDIGAWADYRTQLRKGAKQAGIRID